MDLNTTADTSRNLKMLSVNPMEKPKSFIITTEFTGEFEY